VCSGIFDQCKHAFQYCRPAVLVDGTFLTGKYSGTLMAAAAVDLENQIVPMAFTLEFLMLRVNTLRGTRP
jgi:hypothetical protein